MLWGRLRHDGEIYGPKLLYGHKWLSISEIWSLWKECRFFHLEEELRPIWEGSDVLIRPFVTREWLPIGHDTMGNYIGLDFEPDADGAVARVIRFRRGKDEKTVIAASHEDFFRMLVDDLESATWTGSQLLWPATAADFVPASVDET